MKILVTGATGYLGSRITKELISREHVVSVLVRKKNALEEMTNKVNVFFYDGSFESVLKPFQSYEQELVIHLASCVIREHKSHQIDCLLDSNIRFGLQILEAMKNSRLTKFINTGSSFQCYQNSLYDPVCLYAATKKSFEDLIYFYHQVYNFDVLNLILYDSYGPDDPRKKLLAYFKESLSSKEPVAMSNGFQQIDMVYISDIVSAYLVAIDFICNNKKFFFNYAVRTDNPKTIREIAQIYEKICGRKLNILWGGMQEPLRVVMHPPTIIPVLKGWRHTVDIVTGLKKCLVQ